jgi:hypothetical protein
LRTALGKAINPSPINAAPSAPNIFLASFFTSSKTEE